jgi:hypothetical protein
MFPVPESSTLQIRISKFITLIMDGRLYAVVLMVLLIQGCTVLADKEQTVKHYRLDKPQKFNMPESLLEISGITLYKGKNDTLYAIQDEQGGYSG